MMMRPRRDVMTLLVLWAALSLACPRTEARGEEVERLLAAVNGRVVNTGDLRLARNLNSLMVLGKASAESVDKQLDRLIDLEILRQELEVSPAVRAAADRVEARLQDLRNAYAEIGGLPGLLRRLGLDESELAEYIALQISVENFIASRFRPFVNPTAEERQAYYRETLLPRLAKIPGARVPPFDEVSDEIGNILTEQGVLASLEQWLRDVRRHSRIELFTESPAGGRGQ